MINKKNKQIKKAARIFKSRGLHCRGDRIRTCDTLVPNQVRYRAALHPETNVNHISMMHHLSLAAAKVVKIYENL